MKVKKLLLLLCSLLMVLAACKPAAPDSHRRTNRSQPVVKTAEPEAPVVTEEATESLK